MVQGKPRSSPSSALTHCQAFAAYGTQEVTPFMKALSLSHLHTWCKHCHVMAPQQGTHRQHMLLAALQGCLFLLSPYLPQNGCTHEL